MNAESDNEGDRIVGLGMLDADKARR